MFMCARESHQVGTAFNDVTNQDDELMNLIVNAREFLQQSHHLRHVADEVGAGLVLVRCSNEGCNVCIVCGRHVNHQVCYKRNGCVLQLLSEFAVSINQARRSVCLVKVLELPDDGLCLSLLGLELALAEFEVILTLPKNRKDFLEWKQDNDWEFRNENSVTTTPERNSHQRLEATYVSVIGKAILLEHLGEIPDGQLRTLLNLST